MLKMTIDSPRGKCRPQMPSQYKELLKSTAQVKRFFNAIKSLIAHLQKSLTNFWIDTQLNRWILSYDNNVILKLNWKWNQITKFSSPDKPDRCSSGLARSGRVFVAPHRMLAWKCPPLQVLLQGHQGDKNIIKQNFHLYSAVCSPPIQFCCRANGYSVREARQASHLWAWLW